MKRTILTLVLACSFGWTHAQKSDVIDKVVAVVGRDIILHSDIAQELYQMQMQGYTIGDDSECNILENLLVQKLLLNKARIDSIKVNEAMIVQEIDQRMGYYMAQLGSKEAVEKYFAKPAYRIREDLRSYVTEKYLTEQAQRAVLSSKEITPQDVHLFYKKTPKDSLPVIPEQYIMQQISLYPPSEGQAKFEAKEKLLDIRKRINEGEKFQTLAILYSEDASSAVRGGELGMRNRSELVKPFSDAAMTLKPGQISQIVESEFGFHLIQLIEKKGEYYNARHILIKPEFSPEEKAKVMKQLDSMAQRIRLDSITFENAALQISQDKDSRLNGGYMVNSTNLSNKFDKDQLPPADYKIISGLAVGKISEAFDSKDGSGNAVAKIIKLKEVIPAHTANIKDDYVTIYTLAKNEYQKKAYNQWVEKAIQSAYIKIDPDFKACKFERTTWFK